MKVLGIVCSPRKGGNTEIMVKAALEGAESYGAETDFWTTAGKELRPCDACYTCGTRGGECHIKDGMQELYPRILAADGIIFGSPVYFLSMTAQAKIVIDRLYCLYDANALHGKVAGVVSAATSIGHDGVRIGFSDFITLCHMFLADHTWGYGDERGDVRKDKFAMKSAEELGKQVASLVKQRLSWPEEYTTALFDVCKSKYGVESYPLRRF